MCHWQYIWNYPLVKEHPILFVHFLYSKYMGNLIIPCENWLNGNDDTFLGVRMDWTNKINCKQVPKYGVGNCYCKVKKNVSTALVQNVYISCFFSNQFSKQIIFSELYCYRDTCFIYQLASLIHFIFPR